MKKNSKLAVFLPILLGVAIALVLIVIGDMENEPALYALGILGGYFLILFGVNKTGIIKKGLFTPILLLSFAVFILLFVAVALFDSQFADTTEYAALFIIIAVVFAVFGVLGAARYRKAAKKAAAEAEKPAVEAPSAPAEEAPAKAEEAPAEEAAPAEANEETKE